MKSWIWRLVAGLASACAAAAMAQSLGWSQLPGAAVDVGVGANGTAWAIGTTPEIGGYAIYRWNGSNNWDKIPGSALRIDVDPHGNAWVVTSGHAIFRYDGRQFVAVPGAANDIGIGADGSVWVIGNDAVGRDYGIYRWTGSTWARMPGAALRIDVDPHGMAWVVNSAHQVFRWNGSSWTQMPGAAVDIGIGSDGSVFCVGPNGAVWRFNGNDWTAQDGALTNISVDNRGFPWGVNGPRQIWRATGPGAGPAFTTTSADQSPWGTLPTVKIVAGDNQQAQSNAIVASASRVAVFAPLKVLVADGTRKPVPNAHVKFTCQRLAPGYCNMDPAARVDTNVLDVVTDASGVATLDKATTHGWTGVSDQKSVLVWDGYGPFTVVASYGAQTATFHLVVAQDPWTMAVVSGDNQKVPRTDPGDGVPIAFFAPLQVAVKDSAGRGIANMQVMFACSAPYGMVCGLDGRNAPNLAVVTDGNGIATLASFADRKSVMAYYADGPITIGAKAGSATSVFHLTVGK